MTTDRRKLVRSFKEPAQPDQYKVLAWQVWMTIDHWMYARQTSGLDYLSLYDFLKDVRALLLPHLNL
ncbi:MAG: hypothetical protein WBB36_16590, partial [Chitinophagales bacterium]